MLKTDIRNNGYLSTEPTEKGKKDIDVFHPSYRVKNINKEPLLNFFKNGDERYLEIESLVQQGLIVVKIEVDQQQELRIHNFLEACYLFVPGSGESAWNLVRKEVLRILHPGILVTDIINELKQELKEAAENSVIEKGQEKFKAQLMTGPFQCQENPQSRLLQDGRKHEDDLFKDRERLNVMGVIMHQIDNNTHIVSAAIVDHYGELVAHKDFMHLLPPRKFVDKQVFTDEEREKLKKIKLSHQEEMNEHTKDIDRMKALIHKHSVDLIVVGANKLEARRVKETLKDICEKLKNFGPSLDQEEEENQIKQGKKNKGHQQDL